MKSILAKAQKIKLKKKLVLKFFVGFFGVLGIVAISALAVFTIFLYQLFGTDLKKAPDFAGKFFDNPENGLKQDNGRTNLLLLGMGGESHSGSDLTDTMIFFSIAHKNGDIMMMSVPRDIWVDSMQAKINAVYHYGREESEDRGYENLRQVFSELFGQEVHYFLQLDFESFASLIDLVGGIEVEVERGFDDYKYPIEGRENDLCNGDHEYKCRYEHISFERGVTFMDGTTALKFVRSRNAEGEEGTDFARSERQQKIISALKQKLLSVKTLSSAKNIKQLYDIYEEYVVFNPQLKEEEKIGFAKLGYKYFTKQNGFRTLYLETGDEDNPGFLTVPPVNKYGQWVLEPSAEDWKLIKDFIAQKVNGGY